MAKKIIEARVIQKVATEAEWLQNNLVLYKGEIALVSSGDNVVNMKVGDGAHAFAELEYMYRGGFQGSINPTTSTTTLTNGFYFAETSGTYTNANNVVVAEGYYTILEKNDSGWKVASSVKMPEVDVTPINNRITALENEILIINKIDSFTGVGTINIATGVALSSNANFRYNNTFFEVKKGDRVQFGSNVLVNTSSTSSLLHAYNLDDSHYKSVFAIKDITIGGFVEREWIADKDCKLRIITNITVSEGTPYLRVVKEKYLPKADVATAVNDVINTPPILIEKTEPINLIGYYHNDGRVNTSTNTTRKTDYIKLREGDRVEFGVNGASQPASAGAILNIFDLDYNLVENKIKFIDHLLSWFEGSYTATRNCYVGISTTTTNYDPVKVPYVKSFKSNKSVLNVNDVDVLIPSQDSFNALAEMIDSNNSIINDKTYINEGKKIVISGTSFSYASNGWFELMCTKLGVEGVNKSYSGERIDNFAGRINAGTFFTQDILNECDALMILHSNNKDVFTISDITVNGNVIEGSDLENYTVSQYEALNWDRLTNLTAGWDGPDAEFAAVFDYVLKKVQTIYYEERNNSESIYYNSKSGKPFNVVLCTSWQDNRVTFNESIRKLAVKWGLVLCRFDDNIGFSKNKLHVSGVQHSTLYALIKEGGVLDLETIDGVQYAWHPERGQDKYIQKRMASIAKRCFEVI